MPALLGHKDDFCLISGLFLFCFFPVTSSLWFPLRTIPVVGVSFWLPPHETWQHLWSCLGITQTDVVSAWEVVCVFPLHILCYYSVREDSCPFPVFSVLFWEHFVEDQSLLTVDALGQLARQDQWHVQVHNTWAPAPADPSCQGCDQDCRPAGKLSACELNSNSPGRYFKQKRKRKKIQQDLHVEWCEFIFRHAKNVRVPLRSFFDVF